MPVPVLQNTFFASQDNPNTSLSVTLSGILAGELLVAICGHAAHTSSADHLTMSGWTKYAEYPTASGPYAAIFWKKAVGGETSASFSAGTSDELTLAVLRISGADTVDPFDAIANQLNTSASSTVGVTGVTTTVDNTLAIMSYTAEYTVAFSSPVLTLTGHPPWTFIGDSNAVGSIGDMRTLISYQGMAVAGLADGAAYNMRTACIGTELTFSIKSGKRRIFIS